MKSFVVVQSVHPPLRAGPKVKSILTRAAPYVLSALVKATLVMHGKSLNIGRQDGEKSRRNKICFHWDAPCKLIREPLKNLREAGLLRHLRP